MKLLTPGLFARFFYAAVLAGALAAGRAGAYSLLDNAPGGRLPMNLVMQELIGDQPVLNAMAQWNQAGIGPELDHEFFSAQVSGASGGCGYNQINEVTSSDTICGLAFGDSTLAVTAAWFSAGKVIEVDILFNTAKRWGSYSGPLIYNGSGMAINDINRIALHELGHAAGLNHPDEAGQSVSSIMNSHVGDTDTLQADDIAGARAIAWRVSEMVNAPVCMLTTQPAMIEAGGNSTLIASCTPAATSYSWTNTGFGSTTSAGIVSPSTTTTYQLIGYNAVGAGNAASATVAVVAAPSFPELEIMSLTGPGGTSAGAQAILMAEVLNHGGSTTTPFRIGFYLSRSSSDGVIDLVVGTCSLTGGLMAGQTSMCTGTATIPASITAGTYLLRAVVDDTLAVSESDETNNTTIATPDVFIVAAARLPVCTLMATPAAISAGGSTTLIASCSPAATSYIWSGTGFGAGSASGIVTPAQTTSYSVVGVNAAGAGSPVNTVVLVSGGPANYADLWWAGSAENGWGLSIQQHGNKLFTALYVYDNAGKPVWYVMPSGDWDDANTTYTGLLHQPASAPLSNYTPGSFVPGAAVGSVTITFAGATTAVLRYTINGISGEKAIQRQAFGHGAAPVEVGDMWWGGTTQDGWGISLTQQGSVLFGAWYTYGPDGRASWYVLPNGAWNGTTYTGPFYSTTASAWLGGSYDASRLTVTEAGSMSLEFNDAGNAVMKYTFTSGPFAGTTQSRPIVRQAF